MELASGRQSGYGALQALTAGEIEAWTRIRRIRLRAWEFDALRRLDAKFLAVMNRSED